MKSKIEIDVIGDDDDIAAFIRLMAFINECRMSGHHGIVKLHVDGDGSASISIVGREKQDLIMSKDFEIMKSLDDKDIWIGE